MYLSNDITAGIFFFFKIKKPVMFYKLFPLEFTNLNKIIRYIK